MKRACGTESGTWHVVIETPRILAGDLIVGTACGRPAAEYPRTKPARDVDVNARCRATGCRQAWPPPMTLIAGGAA